MKIKKEAGGVPTYGRGIALLRTANAAASGQHSSCTALIRSRANGSTTTRGNAGLDTITINCLGAANENSGEINLKISSAFK
ncbi:hypothetical protein AB3X94_24660 [Paraburkholderia sp. BR10923]|uniref:hypothetical protein n=1 Tax=Paraburkholderia sp. BR10923 TaxID=3236992 RepID=UPI0034CE2A55